MSSSQDAAQRAHLSLMTQLQECAAAACQPVSTAPAPARATTPSNHVAGRLKPRHERAAAARQPASAAPAQAIGVAKVAESFARLLKSASMTPPQDRFIQAHPGQAALRSIVAAAASCGRRSVCLEGPACSSCQRGHKPRAVLCGHGMPERVHESFNAMPTDLQATNSSLSTAWHPGQDSRHARACSNVPSPEVSCGRPEGVYVLVCRQTG